MIRKPVAVLFVVLLVGCGTGDRRPAGVVPRKKMEAMLWDFMRADVFVNDYVLPRDSSLNANREKEQVFQRVLRFNNVTQADFRKSLDYYMDHPDLMKTVLDSVQTYAQKDADLYNKPKMLLDTALNKIDSVEKKSPENLEEHLQLLKKKRRPVSPQLQ